jgi:uncharacterized small protein (DUF1192 family)
MLKIKTVRLIILMVILTFALGGCSTFKYLDGSTEREVAQFCTGQKVNALGETESMQRRRVEIEQQAQQQISSALEKRRLAEKDKNTISNELDTLKGDVGELEDQIAVLEAENRKFKADKIKSRLENISMNVDMPAHSGSSKANIKVLSGSGTLAPAIAMVKKLEKMGYKIDKMDLAPSTAFPKNKVFFSKGFSGEAKALANTMGSEVVTTPLTWKSKFDIIVVTRNQDLPL